MKQPVRFRQRPLIAVATLAFVLSLGGAVARADDHDDRGHDGRSRYYSDHRYRDDYRSRYHDRDGDRGHHYGHYKRDKHRRDYRHDRYYYDRGYRDGGYYDRGYHDRGYGYGRFVAPHYLYRRDYPAYDRYYRGATYYGPHRHSHRIYLFPVIVGGYTEYRPYAYCGDAYFPGHGYDRYDGAHGHFGLHFNF